MPLIITTSTTSTTAITTTTTTATTSTTITITTTTTTSIHITITTTTTITTTATTTTTISHIFQEFTQLSVSPMNSQHFCYQASEWLKVGVGYIIYKLLSKHYTLFSRFLMKSRETS